jgi:Flp pilus assembly protein TadG
MSSCRARPSRRLAKADRDRGAALVEFAFTMPMLVMILLGILTGGLAYNQKLAVTNGVREGSRFGATLPVASSSCGSGSGSLDCWLAQVANVAESGSEGNLSSSVSSRSICVAYVFPSGSSASDRTEKLVRTTGGDVITVGSTCFSDGRPNTERRVQVSGSRTGSIDLLFQTLTPTLSSDSVTKFEAG